MRIAVVAPSCPIDENIAARAAACAEALEPGVELVFHPQCFLSDGHFAGPDRVRADAFVEAANDRSVDAIWFARGGYGSNRIAEAAIARLDPHAAHKTYLGYSDSGFLLAGLYRAGFAGLAHGPLVADLNRTGGEAAFGRALGWLCNRDPAALEAGLDDAPAAAFNITVLSHLLGTRLEPDLAGHVLLLEEVAEHTYRTDRAMFHITGSPSVRRVRGIRFGRATLVPDNDRPFGSDEEQVVSFWCGQSRIPYLGRADIGHDIDNKIVPFGAKRPSVP